MAAIDSVFLVQQALSRRGQRVYEICHPLLHGFVRKLAHAGAYTMTEVAIDQAWRAISELQT